MNIKDINKRIKLAENNSIRLILDIDEILYDMEESDCLKSEVRTGLI